MSNMNTQQPLQQLIQENCIVDSPIPEQQNFSFLKQEGITKIKALAGHVWNNFNESDPGVTILEQICYALAELGYVNSFPIEDVLTQADGKIAYDQQFFKPEEIFTSAPVTIDDYKRLVFDQFNLVDAIYITSLSYQHNGSKISSGLYQTVLFSKKMSQVDGDKVSEADNLLISVHRFLNQHRNLAEYFLPPTMLKSQKISLSGKITLALDAEPHLVFQEISKALDEFTCPRSRPQGYTQLIESGFDAGTIFSGPLLKNGWICGEYLPGTKRKEVMLTDLITLIDSVSGVSNVEFLEFDGYSGKKSILIEQGFIGEIFPGISFLLDKPHSMINIFSHNDDLDILSCMQKYTPDVCIDLTPPLPEGKFRDIENYYSIQNTFPENYGIGANSLQSDSPDYRIAQSRQLKGYLLFFDQVMANQFSQLANLGRIFSFNNAGISRQNPLIKRYASGVSDSLAMAIPVQSSVQSYYFQPLYNIPDVQALLLGENRYQYFYPDDPGEAKLRKKMVWQRFISDPFNPYHYGLNRCIETEDDAEKRRDIMLSHLLARHGEPADLYNEMIDTFQWYGGKLKTRIIIKSAWLQNLQGLSYRRNCAVNFFMIHPLNTPGRYRCTEEGFRHLLDSSRYANMLEPALAEMMGCGFPDRDSFDSSLIQKLERQIKSCELSFDDESPNLMAITASLSVEDGNRNIIEREQAQSVIWMKDGVFDLDAISNMLKLTEQNYADFSVFELKCDLLLGISRHLQTLASTLVRLIETSEFLYWLAASPQNGEQFPENDSVSSLTESLQDISFLRQDDSFVVKIGTQPVLIFPVRDGSFGKVQLQLYIDQLDWLSNIRRGSILVEETFLQQNPGSVELSEMDIHRDECLRVSLAFPDYVVLMQQSSFINSLREIEIFHFPAHVSLLLRKGNYQQMSKLITAYCSWCNWQINRVKEPLYCALSSEISVEKIERTSKKQNLQQILRQALQVLPELTNDKC